MKSRLTFGIYAVIMDLFYRINVKGFAIMSEVSTDKKFVTYENFGAISDGKTDTADAIFAAHEYANAHSLDVKVKADAVYYLSGKAKTAEIQTNTDFGTAEFIIDDRAVENRNVHIFKVTSKLSRFTPDIKRLAKNQSKIDTSFDNDCFVTMTDSNVKNYIRFGPNQNNGSSQCDCFAVTADGDVKNQIIWDFNDITDCAAYPIDRETLTISGGKFTTIANGEESFYNYYARGIAITRSNVIIDGITHTIEGEGETGAPYGGFLNIDRCAYVTVKNGFFTGHKIYSTIGAAGTSVTMGSYDLSVGTSSDVSFINCKQDDIMDRTRWGLIGTNFCKRLSLDGCVFSRFDAHMGVTDCVIRNSHLGWQCLNTIGFGTFLIENTVAYGGAFVNLREDYGSTWEGDIIIRDCVWYPSGPWPSVVSGHNPGTHDFGYQCKMPENITVEDLVICDDDMPENYAGVTMFNNYDSDYSDNKPYPYITTKNLTMKRVRTTSGREIRLVNNETLFKDLTVDKGNDIAEHEEINALQNFNFHDAKVFDVYFKDNQMIWEFSIMQALRKDQEKGNVYIRDAVMILDNAKIERIRKGKSEVYRDGILIESTEVPTEKYDEVIENIVRTACEVWSAEIIDGVEYRAEFTLLSGHTIEISFAKSIVEWSEFCGEKWIASFGRQVPKYRYKD